MGSWATIAKTAPAPSACAGVGDLGKDPKIAIVDANAIINGLRLEQLADRAVTIQEVLDEIRDKQSRQYLASLPFGFEVREPSEESTAAVTRFARETGDLHSLSATDLKLLALAHTLEVAAYGSAHLREHPVQPRVQGKHKSRRGQQLPGWGTVKNPEDWRVVDEAEEDATSGVVTKNSQQIAALELGEQQGPDAADASLGGAAAADTAQDEQEEGRAGGEEGEDDEDSWDVAARSQAAARRHRRQEGRRQRWLAHQQHTQEQGGQQQQQQQQRGSMVNGSTPAVAAAAAAPAVIAAPAVAAHSVLPASDDLVPAAAKDAAPGQEMPAAPAGSEPAAGTDGQGSSHDEHDSQGSQDSEAGDEQITSSADELDEESDGEGSEGGSQHEEEEQRPSVSSSIVSVTADFAMQNVLLQMGLQLATRDGMRINRLSRWAIRCSACFFVSKEVGRLFCPRCGNMTMDKVEVTVGADGAEYYGARKRHILRGTKYSLPKPRGGRNANNPILREDELMQKLKRRSNKKKKDAADPFAPEFSTDTWHQAHKQLGANKGAAAILAGWKHNPNERKLTRTNRRK